MDTQSSPPARANQKQDREAVRLLAIQIGVREAARKLQLNEDTVCSWAKRGQWFAQPANPQTLQAPQARPGDILLQELAEHERSTKLGLATYAKRQAEHLAERGKLADHGAFRNITAGSAQLHAWSEGKQGNVFSLNVLNLTVLGEGEA